MFEMKYRDCVPQFLALADCQEKIDSSLDSANRKMENLQASLTTAEANMSQLAVCFLVPSLFLHKTDL